MINECLLEEQLMKSRYLYMDILTILSALFVVYLHCTLTVFNFRMDQIWFSSLLIQSIFHWPVLIFIMLSGANLLNYRKRYDTKTFFIKRFKRVGIPFIVWSLVWFIYEYERGFISQLSLKLIIKLFLSNQIQGIFWFFYTIIGLYLCAPIISLICNKKNKRVIEYFILVCLFQFSLIPTVSKLFQINIQFLFDFVIGGPYLSYFLMGWYLTNFPLDKLWRNVVYYIGILSCLCLIIGTTMVNYFTNTNRLNIVFLDYNSIFVFFLSVAVFVLFQSISWNAIIESKHIKSISILSSASLGVYIIHRFLIFEIDRHFSLLPASFFYIIVYPFIIYILSVGTILLLKQIPFLKRIIP